MGKSKRKGDGFVVSDDEGDVSGDKDYNEEVEAEESDDGTASAGSGSEEVKPKKKKARTEDVKEKKPAATSSTSTSDARVNEEGEKYFALDGKKRLTIRSWKGKTLIDIREYYTDASGAHKPGKKGISLNVENWNALTKAVDEVNALIKK